MVLLVLDGLGWEQLQALPSAAPTLAAATGGPITSVAPTTTATALTSLTTGVPPSTHGVLGYRLRVDVNGLHADGPGEVMNVLRWRTGRGDMRQVLPPSWFQTVPPFGGRSVAVVTRSEFAATGFTAAHLTGARLVGWSVPSSLVVGVRRLLAAGETFVYAYYDGLDKVAHEHGLGEHYRQELGSVDRLVSDLLDVLPPGAVLAVTSTTVRWRWGTPRGLPAPELFDMVELFSGEGRFRWLHVRPGSLDDAVAARPPGPRRRGLDPDSRRDGRRRMVRRSAPGRRCPPTRGRGARGPRARRLPRSRRHGRDPAHGSARVAHRGRDGGSLRGVGPSLTLVDHPGDPGTWVAAPRAG